MMLLRFIFQASILGGLLLHGLDAVLDGRATIITVDSMYTFTDGEYALGFVSFNKGFTVPAGQTAYIGVIPPVNGPINLNETGVIGLSQVLQLGPATEGFTNGGIIATVDGQQGSIILGNDITLSNPLVFRNSMQINLGQHFLTLQSTDGARGSLMIDNTVSQTVIIRNGWLRGVEDFTTGFAPRLRASGTSGGCHGYTFNRTTLQFMTDGTMTATGYDLIFQGLNNKISCVQSSNVLAKAGLYIGDLTEVFLDAGVTLSLDTVFASSYFSIGNGGSLALNSARFVYNKPIYFPAPLMPKNMVSSLVIQGESTIEAAGTDSDTDFTIGSSGAYNYDAIVDIYPLASLQMKHVSFKNRSNNH